MGKKKLTGWERLYEELESNINDIVEVKKDEEGDISHIKVLLEEDISLDISAMVNMTITVDKNSIEGWLEDNGGDVRETVQNLLNELEDALSDLPDIYSSSYSFEGFVCSAQIESGGWLEPNLN